MQQIRMLTGRRGWFSDEAWWAGGQVIDVAEDVAAYLVDEVKAAAYVIAEQPEPLTADDPPAAMAVAPTVEPPPVVAKIGKRRP